MENTEDTHRLLTETETRVRLANISRATLFRLRQSGDLTAIKIGKRVAFRSSDIEAFIERSRE